MKRREWFAIAAGLSAQAVPLQAQPMATARARIGVLSFGAAPTGADPDPIEAFRQGMRELGPIEGRNLQIDYRYTQGQPERLAALAAEWLALKVDPIVAGGPAPVLAARALQHRLPSISEITLLAGAGFLLSHGADLNARVRRAASDVDRILQGARPGELAIERPSVLARVVNLKTARALRLHLAPAILQRAARVIE